MSSEHIQVAIRLRPLNRTEIAAGERRVWTITKNTVMVRPESYQILAAEKRVSGGSHPSFQFDHCFSWEDDTVKVYEAVVKRMVVSTLAGYNATVFAYGQTGSGKTFTMLGKAEEDEIPQNRDKSVISRPKKPLRAVSSVSVLPVHKKQSTVPQKGILLLALQDIFQTVAEARQTHYFLSCSYMEIYNEHIYDLLREERDSREILTVSEAADKDFIVKGLSSHPVTTIEDVIGKLEAGEAMRHYAETQMNRHSSRSHTIFRLKVKSLMVLQQDWEEEKSDNAENITTESTLNFVDLAGSERLSSLDSSQSLTKSDQDRTTAEGKHINTSLFYLCQVIGRLSEVKLGVVRSDTYVPFRNSVITKILRGSLGGNARTCVLCTATPAMSQFEQSLSTFRFGASARTITNQVQPNVRHASSAQLLLAYEQDVADLRRELESVQQRTRLVTAEGTELKIGLENRARRLTQLLCEDGKSGGKVRFVGWIPVAGDLISSLDTGQRDETGSLECCLPWDDAGQLATLRCGILNAEITRETQQIDTVSAEHSQKKSLICSLQSQISSFQSSISQISASNSSLSRAISSSAQRLSFLRTRAELYTCGTGLDTVSDDELSALEGELLIAIDRAVEEKGRQKTRKLIERLKESLRRFVPEEEVEEIAAEMDGWSVDTKQLKFPDLSAINASFPSETMDSVNHCFAC